MTCTARRPGPRGRGGRLPATVAMAVAAGTLLAVMAVSATAPALALAGDYHVYSCRIPRGASVGEPAPVQESIGGGEEAGRWNSAVSGNAHLKANTCEHRGALIAALQAGVSHLNGDHSTWVFTAPRGESVVTGTTLWRAGDAEGGEGYASWLASPEDIFNEEDLFGSNCVYKFGCEGTIGSAAVPLSPENEVKVPAGNLPSSHLYINASCSRSSCPGGTGDKEGYAAVAYLYAADIVLEDPTTPTVSEVRGTLAAESTLSGEAHLHFTASDTGSGIYQTIVKVDGKTISRHTVNEENGRCKPLETLPGGERAFLYAQPCPTTTPAEVSLNTATLANGAHTVLVEVINAAGGATVALERTIHVSNSTATKTASGGPTSGASPSSGTTSPAGTPARNPAGGSAATNTTTPAPRRNGIDPSASARLSARWVARGHRARSARRHSHRRHPDHRHRSHYRHSHHRGGRTHLTGPFRAAETIAGRLATRGGTPIARALIDIAATPAYGGARALTLHGVHTNSAGRFHIRLPRRLPSARIQLSYAPTIGGRPATSTTLTLAVRASLTLHVTPHRTSAGHTIHLTGALRGGHVPSGGKQVILEARSKGTRWLQFDVLHTNRRGHFSATHRFRLAGPIHYRFRAVCPREADFPFTTGSSRAVAVFES